MEVEHRHKGIQMGQGVRLMGMGILWDLRRLWNQAGARLHCEGTKVCEGGLSPYLCVLWLCQKMSHSPVTIHIPELALYVESQLLRDVTTTLPASSNFHVFWSVSLANLGVGCIACLQVRRQVYWSVTSPRSGVSQLQNNTLSAAWLDSDK